MEVEDEVQAASEKAILSLADDTPAEVEINRDEIVAGDEEEEFECIPCLPVGFLRF